MGTPTSRMGTAAPLPLQSMSIAAKNVQKTDPKHKSTHNCKN